MKTEINFKSENKPLICVQGMGFVGLAMATVVANALDKNNQPLYNVIGLDLPEKQNLIEKINTGELPIVTEDKSFSIELKRAVLKYKNLKASISENYYNLADIVIVDVHLSIEKISSENHRYKLHIESFEKAIRTLGRLIKEDCLIIIETTVPPGFCVNVVRPIIEEEFKREILNLPRLSFTLTNVLCRVKNILILSGNILEHSQG